jgi:hypothetical protein
MATVSTAHFEFFEADGFQPGDTRTATVLLPGSVAGFLVHGTVVASATPATVSGGDRRLEVSAVSVRARHPEPVTGGRPSVRVTVTSTGADAPRIWYLNIGIIRP